MGVVGGHKQGRKPDSFRFHSTTEVYDHATGSWSTMPALLQLPRASCLAAVLGHGDAPGTQKSRRGYSCGSVGFWMGCFGVSAQCIGLLALFLSR